MSKDKISDYSATANSNTDIGGINIDEGCAPSGINDAIRTLMKQLKDFQQGTNSDSFNGPVNGTVGATTPASGAFTTLSASSTLSVTGAGTIQGLTVGRGAGAVSTNTAVGASALAANTSGAYNVAVGYLAMAANTTGEDNVAVGRIALDANTTGGNNTALGDAALTDNTTGSNNVAVGRQALTANTTASENTAVGYQAGYSNTTGTYSTLIGTQAGYSQTTGYGTYIGYQAGYSETTGQFNTFVGLQSGYAMTTGSKNTILGGYTGNQGGLDIRTASNYIVLSDGDGNPRVYWTSGGNATFTWGTANRTVFNNTSSTAGDCYGLNVNYLSASPNGSGNQFILCSDSTTDRFVVKSNGGISNYSANNTNLSDERTKTDIQSAGSYLAKICAIPVRTFKYKDQTDDLLNLGVIAQEVEAIAPELVDVSGFGETPEDGVPLKAIYQTDLQYALMKALQELKAEFDAYKEAHP